MKKIIAVILFAMVLVTGCSRSAETITPESAADIPDGITIETILQEETAVSQTESSMESVTEIEYPETKDAFDFNEKESRNSATDTHEIEESESQEEELDVETIEEFDDSISETCAHNFEFSDTCIYEEQGDVLMDLYICTKCGAGYAEPYEFAEETDAETSDLEIPDCLHENVTDGICDDCGMDGFAELEDENYEN